MKYILWTLLAIIIAVPMTDVSFAHTDRNAISDIEAADLLKKSEKTDLEYETIGEWVIAKMMGDQHMQQEEFMKGRMGEEFVEQSHIALGKQFVEGGGWGMLPLIPLAGGGGFMTTNGGMMGFGLGGWMFLIVFTVLALVVILALVKWLVNQGLVSPDRKSALEILGARYASGELSKEEFVERKAELEDSGRKARVDKKSN